MLEAHPVLNKKKGLWFDLLCAIKSRLDEYILQKEHGGVYPKSLY